MASLCWISLALARSRGGHVILDNDIVTLDGTMKMSPHEDKGRHIHENEGGEAGLDLLTIDGSGGGTGMSPWNMMESWGMLSVLLHAKAAQAEGFSPEEIATKLFVFRKTVLNHRYAIMNKLGIKTPLAFVRYAVRLGLVDLDDGPEFEGIES